MNNPSKSIPWNSGYYDGWRSNPMKIVHDNMPSFDEYQLGYTKGKEDKEFCEVYSDEAFGIEGYGP